MLLVIPLNGPVVLDTYVNADLIDKTDCEMKCSGFSRYVNKLQASFVYLQPMVRVLSNLLNTHCCSVICLPPLGL